MILIAGDIGGTKSLIALIRDNADGTKNNAYEKIYQSADYESIEALLRNFMIDSGCSDEIVEQIVLAVPGPVTDGVSRLTNLEWVVSEDELRTLFSIRNVKIMNDFQATALGTLSLQPEDYIILNDSHHCENRTRLVMGAGTGLGMAYLHGGNDDPCCTPIATEGGHIDFSPTNEREIELFQYFRKRYERVSYERILSGGGLAELFCFCAGRTLDDFHISAEWVNREATDEGNPIAQEAINLFATIYGRFAGNMVLAFNPGDGLYLTGGVTAKISGWLDSHEFRDAYLDKGRMSDVVKKTPLYLVTNERVGLQGAIEALKFGF
ncbi:MAG: glucokinase [Chromatiales bacterium]|nr:glucokinase [Chromatiales bacterium]